MRIEELKNYGKGLMDSVPDHKGLEQVRRVGETIRSELRNELGSDRIKSLDIELKREMESYRL